ncbi:regulator of Vps4 activity in the MVB pathway-domain-containing protein, partial [Endogone sp. FLAS-F59071]
MVFSPVRLKVQLKLTINRLKMLQAKKASLNQAQRMEIAGLLKNGKVESAKIKVERIIREDYLMEAMEILELYCELLLARFGLLEQMKNCDPSIAEAVNSIIYATPRTDQVRELSSVCVYYFPPFLTAGHPIFFCDLLFGRAHSDIRDQLAAKFGKEFTVAALENQNDVVNPRVRNTFTSFHAFNACAFKSHN